MSRKKKEAARSQRAPRRDAKRALPNLASRALLVTIAIVIAAVVGLSRVYLRVHWLSDVTGGWLRPAVDIIDFSYPHWHRLSDTPQQCSGESMELVGRVLVEWLKQRQ